MAKKGDHRSFAPFECIDDELADDFLIIDLGVASGSDSKTNMCSEDQLYPIQTNGADEYPCRYQRADLSESSLPRSASDNRFSISHGNGQDVGLSSRHCRIAGANGHERTRSQSNLTSNGHTNCKVNVDGLATHRLPGVVDDYRDRIERSELMMGDQPSVNVPCSGRPDRCSERQLEDLPDLKKIETDFDKLLESIQSAAKRELIVNKFIIFLMTKRNSILENVTTVIEDAAAGGDERKRISQSRWSNNTVDGQSNHTSRDPRAERASDRASLTCSPSTSETATVLNLSVPRRRSATPQVDAAGLVMEHCGSCKCGFSSAPRPAHCNESKSPRPPPADSVIEPVLDQPHGSSWSTPSTAAGAAPHECFSWIASEVRPSEVKREPDDVVTVDDEDDKWLPNASFHGNNNNDCGSSNTSMSRATGDRALVTQMARRQPKISRIIAAGQSVRAIQNSINLDRQSALPSQNPDVSAAHCVQLQKSTVDMRKLIDVVHNPTHSSIDPSCSTSTALSPDSLIPDCDLMMSSQEPSVFSSSPTKKPPKSRRSRVDECQKEHIKRPMNSFMCWAHGERASLSKMFPSKNNADISRMLGEKWRKMTPAEKKPYEEQSVKHSEQLLEKHPDYRYRPRRKEKGRLHVQKLLNCTDVDSTLSYGTPAETCYGAIAGLMSLNQGWIGVPTTSGHALRDVDATGLIDN